jgi:uncharacterized membrane protein YdbT with pleckstrin-like domain
VSQLMPGEVPIRVAHQHWTVFLPTGLVCAVALIAGSVLLAVTPGRVGGHDIGEVKLLIGLGLGLVAVAVVLVRWVQWRYLTFTLTNHRIVVRRGILSRFTESITLDRIQDSGVRQRLLGRVLSFGDVEIESAGRDGKEVLRHIADPVGFSNDLLVASEARRSGQALGGPPGAGPAGPGMGEVPPTGYAPPAVQGSAPPGGYGPAPGYTRHHDGL